VRTPIRSIETHVGYEILGHRSVTDAICLLRSSLTLDGLPCWKPDSHCRAVHPRGYVSARRMMSHKKKRKERKAIAPHVEAPAFQRESRKQAPAAWSLPASSPGGNQVNPRLTLLHTQVGPASAAEKGEGARERERDGFRSGTRPEPQRAVTKRLVVRHTYTAHTDTDVRARASKLDGFLT
jgi:ribosomal protein L44E